MKAFYLKKHNEVSTDKRLQLDNAQNSYICSNEDPGSGNLGSFSLNRRPRQRPHKA